MNNPTQRKDLVIWRLLDGRAGHENQVIGLSEAFSRRVSVECFDIQIRAPQRGFRSLLPGRLNTSDHLPKPDFLIAAGHSTHFAVLALQRRFGGRSIVIMKPTLPTSLFDICLIPAHDEVSQPRANVIVTEGAVNRIRPDNRRTADTGLILIGGPCRHFEWSNECVLQQIREVVERNRLPCVLATSQRTPESFRKSLFETGLELPVKACNDFDSSWLASTLAHSQFVWVTCDSMSMIYEAITSGADVGLLELCETKNGRLSRNINRLSQCGLATPWSDWSSGKPLCSQRDFSEADRCADLLLKRFGYREFTRDCAVDEICEHGTMGTSTQPVSTFQ
jgi:mitochondrial fission protein ELM1